MLEVAHMHACVHMEVLSNLRTHILSVVGWVLSFSDFLSFVRICRRQVIHDRETNLHLLVKNKSSSHFEIESKVAAGWKRQSQFVLASIRVRTFLPSHLFEPPRLPQPSPDLRRPSSSPDPKVLGYQNATTRATTRRST